jgi:hypothetical protein
LKLPDCPPVLMSEQVPPPEVELLDEELLLEDDELEEELLEEELLLEDDELEEELLEEEELLLEDDELELLLEDPPLLPPNCASTQPWKRSQVK